MRRTMIGALLALVLLPLHLAAQESRGIVTIAGGATNYDLSGVGWAPAGALRVGLPLAPWLILEPAVGWMRYETQGDVDVTIWMPEAQLQLEILRGSVRPYFGAGAGFARFSGGGDSETDLTLSAAVGVRTLLSPRIGLVAEGRLRSIDPWTGTTADVTAGVTIGF